MAITVNAQITGQDVTSTTSYCYLYEPLKVNISESDILASKIYIDLTVIDVSDGSVVATESEYGDFDINVGSSLSVDLMRIAAQYHDANVLKIGTTADISLATDIPVSKYKYQFGIYSDKTTAKTIVSKLPIIGIRNFYDFAASVTSSSPLTEASLYGIDLTGRWLNYPNISNTLASPSATDSSPSITITTENSALLEPCGGMLIWKSRFGGWMYWGMDIATRNTSGTLSGNLEVGSFEATSSGNPYVKADYTNIDSSYTITLKALSLSTEELKAVSGISDSIAVYYMRDSSAKLELMRLTSSSAPISTLIGGGDFSVTLKSISTASQKSR